MRRSRIVRTLPVRLAKAVNAVMKPLGLRFVRSSHSPSFPSFTAKTAGRFVECIGPSGVGKTTVLDGLLQLSSHHWSRRSDIQGIESAVVKFQRLEGDDFYSELLRSRASKPFQGQYPVDRAVSVSRHLQNMVLLDRAISASGWLEKTGVMLDEGLVHNNTEAITAILRSEGKIPLVLERRVFIFLHTEVDVVMSRLQNRLNAGSCNGNNWLSYLPYDQVEERTRLSLQSKKLFMEVWAQLGGEGYSVDVTDSSHALERLIQIERGLVGGAIEKSSSAIAST